ncbi:MAG: hypothetical protein IKS32_09325 [Solobacterium sp.]|nr:hypothetical protein [Solobacterium sp.]
MRIEPEIRVPIPAHAPVNVIQMMWLFNPNSGEHFYTGNAQKKAILVRAGWKTKVSVSAQRKLTDLSE